MDMWKDWVVGYMFLLTRLVSIRSTSQSEIQKDERKNCIFCLGHRDIICGLFADVCGIFHSCESQRKAIHINTS